MPRPWNLETSLLPKQLPERAARPSSKVLQYLGWWYTSFGVYGTRASLLLTLVTNPSAAYPANPAASMPTAWFCASRAPGVSRVYVTCPRVRVAGRRVQEVATGDRV